MGLSQLVVLVPRVPSRQGTNGQDNHFTSSAFQRYLDTLIVIMDYTSQIISLSKMCKRLWSRLRGLRITSTRAWNWVKNDVVRMYKVRHLIVQFNDNTAELRIFIL